jgi:hypothetical protein
MSSLLIVQKMAQCDSKMCNCLAVMRELVAENMLLQQQLEDKKHLAKMLKKEIMLQR